MGQIVFETHSQQPVEVECVARPKGIDQHSHMFFTVPFTKRWKARHTNVARGTNARYDKWDDSI